MKLKYYFPSDNMSDVGRYAILIECPKRNLEVQLKKKNFGYNYLKKKFGYNYLK